MGQIGLIATTEGMRHAPASEDGMQVLPGDPKVGGGEADPTDALA